MKFKKTLMTCALAVLSVVTVDSVRTSSSSVQNVIDETYVQPDYVLGYSLSGDQYTQTLTLLGYDSSMDTNVKTITTGVYANIMSVADDSSLRLYSPTKIQKSGSSETLAVNIITPKNIAEVTEDMYRSAAVTLGIEHVATTVTSPIVVTGESALAGIYHSSEEDGADISDKGKELAREELEALSAISSESQGVDGYDADKLSIALTDAKSAIADVGDSVSKEDVHKIVEETLDNYELEDALLSDQITLTVSFVFSLSKSGIIDNGSFESTLVSLKDSTVSNAGSTFKGISLNFDATDASEPSKDFLVNIWQTIVNFFKNLLNWAANL